MNQFLSSDTEDLEVSGEKPLFSSVTESLEDLPDKMFAEYNKEDRIQINISWTNLENVLTNFWKYIETETLSTINNNLNSFNLEKEIEIWEQKVNIKLKK